MRFEESIIVNVSPKQAQNFFADIQNLPKWDRGVARVELIAAGAAGGGSVGTTFDTIGFGERGRMSYRVTEVGALHTTVVTHSGFFKEAYWHFQLQPAPEGTRIICITEFNLRLRYLFLAPVLYLTAKRGAVKTDLEHLKRVLEAD